MGVVDGCEPWELFLFSKREMELQKKKKNVLVRGLAFWRARRGMR